MHVIKGTIRRLCGAAIFIVACSGITTPEAKGDEAPIASGQQTNGKVRAEILSVKRTEGDTLTVRFAIINDGNQPLSITVLNMKLIDLVNRRSYAPGLTSPSCRTEPGERTICWAIFAAPNASVKTINVLLNENFDLISVPLTN